MEKSMKKSIITNILSLVVLGVVTPISYNLGNDVSDTLLNLVNFLFYASLILFIFSYLLLLLGGYKLLSQQKR